MQHPVRRQISSSGSVRIANRSGRPRGAGNRATPQFSRRRPSGLHQRIDLLEDLSGFGEATDLLLAPDLRAIDVHVKDAAAALDEFAVHAVFALDRVRQTGGPGVIVSFAAVLDPDVHASLLPSIEHAAGGRRCSSRYACWIVVRISEKQEGKCTREVRRPDGYSQGTGTGRKVGERTLAPAHHQRFDRRLG
jgi:hypothetical protein